MEGVPGTRVLLTFRVGGAWGGGGAAGGCARATGSPGEIPCTHFQPCQAYRARLAG